MSRETRRCDIKRSATEGALYFIPYLPNSPDIAPSAFSDRRLVAYLSGIGSSEEIKHRVDSLKTGHPDIRVLPEKGMQGWDISFVSLMQA